MDQHPLIRTQGSVVFELILVMPLVLLILVFVLESECVLRTAWSSQMASRIVAWSLNRIEAAPSPEALAEALQVVDPRARGCTVRLESLGSARREFDESIGSIASTLPGSLGSHFGDEGSASGGEATAHLGAKWGETSGRCVLNARSWTAYELGTGGRDYLGVGEELSAPAMTRHHR